MAAPINVSEFHRVEESPERFVRFLDAQERVSPVAALLLPYLGDDVERLLDVGCGLGGDTSTLREAMPSAVQVLGVDVSSTMVKEATARHARPGLRFVVASAESLPCPDGSFDAGVSARTLQHLHDPEVALRELHRVIRPGGCIAVLDIDHGAIVLDCEYPEVLERVRAATNRQLSPNIGRSLRRHLLRAGFRDVKVEVMAKGMPGHLALSYDVLAKISAEAVKLGAVTEAEAELLRAWWQQMEAADDGYAVVLRFLGTARR